MSKFLLYVIIVRGFGLHVLDVGPPRTGTQSIADALTTLGLNVLHSGFVQSSRPVACRHLYGNGTNESMTELFEGYDAAADEPLFLEYEFVRDTYPNSKFVLPLVPMEKWWNSTKHYWNSMYFRYERNKIRGLKVKREQQELEAWLDGFWTGHFGATFENDKCVAVRYWGCRFDRLEGMSDDEKRNCQSGYEAHVAHVKQAIPPERLLVFNLSDGWRPLCQFLGKPIPNEPFPHDDFIGIYDEQAELNEAGTTLLQVDVETTWTEEL